MSTEVTTMKSVKSLLDNPDIKKKFQDMLGERMQGFFVSVSNCVNNNKALQKADPNSVIMAAGVAASLDLPIDQNLGFAYILPYTTKYKDDQNRWQEKQVAQFQIGYKGFKQLALRSGQFLTINAEDVREGEIVKRDRLSGEIEFKWIEDEVKREATPIIGYVSFFKLLNGYTQTFYMSRIKLLAHGKKYSQTFKNDKGLWKDDEASMMLKTVTKLNLSKNAPLSVQMQKAVIADQSVIKDVNNDVIDTEYVDNTPESININQIESEKQNNRLVDFINGAKTLVELQEVEDLVHDAGLTDLYIQKKDELTKK